MVYEYTKPRAPIAAMYSSPGPCYALPGLVGQGNHDPRSVHNRGPSYPFGVRHGKWRDDCSPGPCYFPNPKVYRDGLDGTPHYSLYARQRDMTSFKTPGPGAYMPERAGPTSKAMAPQYSFGIRYKHRRTDDTPAANKYQLPGMLGRTIQSQKRQAPCYSLTGRSKTGSFHEDLQKTPGPGAYRTVSPDHYRSRQPQYSLTGRNTMPGDSTQKPGPGAHSPEKVFLHKRQPPQFSFGIRHSQYTAPLIVDVQD
ncbi:hypothetical protein LSH36_9g12036 [Paralvinella palmiformis]|uniref:Outer dense fiber protein 3-like protein 2 n=1 Tax=Paralvinella palmiformis TaxID=53620 RepID=A0AAD9KE29_9ANNE|nr:hypothetical protein LSH36_9g12036 [Paralvinella palmiformis]